MKAIHSALKNLFAAALACAVGGMAQEAPPERYIVMVKRGVAAAKVADDSGASADLVFRHAINGFAGVLSRSRVEELRRRRDVLSVERDRVVSLDGHAARAEAVAFEEEIIPSGVARCGASANPRTDLSAVGIAIIDTGLSLAHPDLNIIGAVSFVEDNMTGEDDHGHGSHVAGIAAAKINGIGVRGVAPNARLFGIKVLDKKGKGRVSQIIAGVDWLAQNASANGIQVANMSIGFRGSSEAFDAAIANLVARGVTLVVAAGNSHRNAALYSPANHPDVIAVSALADSDGQPGHLGRRTAFGPDDTLARFSNFGGVVELAAPGVKIYSTYRDGEYAKLSGTSMAAPHVAGAAALYAASHPSATPAEVKAALLSAAWPQSSAAGFTKDRDEYPEPLLNAADL